MYTEYRGIAAKIDKNTVTSDAHFSVRAIDIGVRIWYDIKNTVTRGTLWN